MPEHLREPPDEAFWRHRLGFKGYRRLEPKLADDGWVADQVKELYKGAIARELVSGLTADSDHVGTIRQHLVLAAKLVEGLKTSALIDVACALAGEDEAKRCEQGPGRWARHPLALMAYVVDPTALLSMVVCDRWHALRRCVMTVSGRVPDGTALTLERVLGAVETGLEEWKGARLTPRRMDLLQAFERNPGEVLVGFRRPFNPDGLWTEDGELIEGFTAEPVVLRFMENGHRVDVTATRLQDAVGLADSIGSVLIGKHIHYTKRRLPVTESVLDAFLRRACHPDADDLQLVEVKAEMLGEPGRPTKTIHGSGRNRIEHTVLREPRPYAESWKTVHHVKVLFEGYRFAIHFPVPGADLELTYSDLGRPTTVAEDFEKVIEKLKDSLGADILIQPRSEEPGGKRKVRQKHPKKPGRITVAHRRRLLDGVVDDPVRWEAKMLEGWRNEGLVSWRTAWFFRCGDLGIDRFASRASTRTLDCDGIVEWENKDKPEDPFADLPEDPVECSCCSREWNPLDKGAVLHRRLYVDVGHDVAWRHVRETVGKRVRDVVVEGPGLASGMWRRQRIYVAYLPLTTVDAVKQVARGHPVAWFGLVNDPRLLALAPGGGDLAELKTGEATWVRVLDGALPAESTTATSGTRQPTPSPASRTRRAPPAKSPPEIGRVVKVGSKTKFYAYESVEQLDAGQPIQQWDVLAGNAAGSRVLLAVLADAAAEDDGNGNRELRHLQALAGRHPVLKKKLAPETFYRWVQRTRERFDRVAPGVGRLVIVGDDPDDAAASTSHGYCLGERYAVVGFQLEAEVQKWKSHGKNKPQTPISS